MILLFIWPGGVASRGVIRFDLAVDSIDDGEFGGSSRYGGSVLASAIVALYLVYILAAE